jgi:hypothetical protein
MGKKIDGYRYKVIYNINSRLEDEKKSSTENLSNEAANDPNDKKNFSSSLKVTTSKSYQIAADVKASQEKNEAENDLQVKVLEQQIASLKAEIARANAKEETDNQKNENVQYLNEHVKKLDVIENRLSMLENIQD